MRARNLQARRASGRLRVVILAVPPVEELDLIGPWEVFASANTALGDKGKGYQIELVTTSRKRTFTGDTGLTLTANRRFHSLGGEVDTLIVPGGTGAMKMRDAAVLKWLRGIAKKVRRLASVCTGAFLLAETGLLDGKRTTTHWKFAEELSARHPQVTVERDRIYVQDGKIYTSAGVTAGMDLSLALVEEDFGSAVALQVARALVLYLRRPGGQSQFSVLLSRHSSGYKPFRELQVWMAENLAENLSVEKLAARAAMSPRNFARVFAREAGVTPAHFVQQLRVEAARRELETKVKGLDAIAEQCGFSSAEIMRRAFLRTIKVSPGGYRDRFFRRSAK
jgi:transcriptional regulator GlxA family with amidase domain